VRSFKTEKLPAAQGDAKQFFITFSIVDAEHSGKGRSAGKSISRSFVLVGNNFAESQNLPDKVRRYMESRICFNKELVPHFGEKDMSDTNHANIVALVNRL
jgi:hypothetical protein